MQIAKCKLQIGLALWLSALSPPPLLVQCSAQSTAGLVSYWKLDESSGDVGELTPDAHGANTLEWASFGTQNARLVPGKIGSAVDLEALDADCVIHDDNASLSVGDIDFSACAWVKLESVGADRTICGQYDFGNNQRSWAIYYKHAEQKFVLLVSSNGQSAGNANVVAALPAPPSVGVWYFVCAWHDASANTINIQIDDGAVYSTPHAAGVHDSTAKFTLGAMSNNGALVNVFDGLVDEVGFWKRVLTPAQRTRLYNGGNALPYPWSQLIFANHYQ